MALAPVAYVLWTRFLRYNPRNPQWEGRDRFVLSAGHASMLLYGLLHLTGYDLSLDEIKSFRQLGSITAGHPERGSVPGIETTTGPLGQGFGNGVGMGIAQKMLAARYNRPDYEICPSTIYAICSDGDLMEGVSGESASLAGHLRLGNLVYIYDNNRITIDGSTDLSFSESVGRRFDAYGWHVQALGDDASLDDMAAAIEAARADERPSLIELRTHIAEGSPNAHDTSAAHGAPLGEDEVRMTKRNLGLPPDKDFYVPDEVAAHMGEAVARGARMEAEWNDLLGSYEREYPDLAAEWRRVQARKLPRGWDSDLPRWSKEDDAIATRAASGKVLNAIVPSLPELVGGSADLAGSTGSALKDQGDVAAGQYGGRNLHFGVREHAMGAALSGIAEFGGLRAYGATFLVFSDYMRPSIRLAAMMGLPINYLFSHDSIWLGEDGPTHQPVEHLASLRAIPNLTVIRPADANETAVAWKCAISRDDGPTALALSRQKLPIVTSGLDQAQDVARGAYVLTEAPGDPPPQAILIATGSEVHLALQARERLAAYGLDARVVSMPSWELFEEQDVAYRERVLPPAVRARVSIEAGVAQGWQRYIGPGGASISLERYGTSAPAAEAARALGFASERIASAAMRTFERAQEGE